MGSAEHEETSGSEVESEVESLSSELDDSQVTAIQNDMRVCALCNKVGDDRPHRMGRLIPSNTDQWLHINCALVSTLFYIKKLESIY